MVTGGVALWMNRANVEESLPSRARVLLDELQEAVPLLNSIGDLDFNDFASVLPPPPSNCRGTVVIALEGTVLAKDFDRASGNRVVVRTGLRELLLYLGNTGFETVLWSPICDATAAGGYLDKIVDDLVRGTDRKRWLEFNKFIDNEARVASAFLSTPAGAPLAQSTLDASSRAPHPLRTHYLDSEKRTMYAERVLRIVAVLGKQHGQPSDIAQGNSNSSSPSHGRIIPLHLLPRKLESVLLLDASPAAALVYPQNTVVLPPFNSGSRSDTSLTSVLRFLEFYEAAVNLTAAKKLDVCKQLDDGARIQHDGAPPIPLDLSTFLCYMRDNAAQHVDASSLTSDAVRDSALLALVDRMAAESRSA